MVLEWILHVIYKILDGKIQNAHDCAAQGKSQEPHVANMNWNMLHKETHQNVKISYGHGIQNVWLEVGVGLSSYNTCVPSQGTWVWFPLTAPSSSFLLICTLGAANGTWVSVMHLGNLECVPNSRLQPSLVLAFPKKFESVNKQIRMLALLSIKNV